MSIDLITLWHQRARPNPTLENLGVQAGCHAEEFHEMLEALQTHYTNGDEPNGMLLRARIAVKELADALKSGRMYITINDREEFLDSLADQIVTATGVGHCAGMNVTEACRRVNASNWSKYDRDGQPIFNPNGKIAKGSDYQEPDLDGLY